MTYICSTNDLHIQQMTFTCSKNGFYIQQVTFVCSTNDFYIHQKASICSKNDHYIQQAVLKKSPVNSYWPSQHCLKLPKSFIQRSQWLPLSRCNNTFTNFDSFANSSWAIKHLLFVLGPFYPNKSFLWYSRAQWRLIFWQVILSILNLHMSSFNRYF